MPNSPCASIVTPEIRSKADIESQESNNAKYKYFSMVNEKIEQFTKINVRVQNDSVPV